jgi:ATP/ADP translocase
VRSPTSIAAPPPWAASRWTQVRAALPAFFVFLLMLTAYSMLETARDGLLLTRLPAKALGVVYLSIAALALPVSNIAGRAAQRFGARRVLLATLVIAGGATLGMALLPFNRPASVVVFYTVSGLIGSIVPAQFWMLVARTFTVAEARRWLSFISSAGMVGAVVGSWVAAAVVPRLHVGALLPLAGVLFCGVAGLLWRLQLGREASPRGTPAPQTAPSQSLRGAFRQEPFLGRIALLVVLSTSALVAIDYYFKWTVSHALPADYVEVFIARLYAGLTALSLVMQLALGTAVVRKFGVPVAVLITPALMLLGAAGAFPGRETILAAILFKALDSALRYPLHRPTAELLYFPVRADLRERAKPFIDGALSRGAQALPALAFLVLARWLTPGVFMAAIACLGLAWMAVAWSMRRGYLELLQRSLRRSDAAPLDAPPPLDLASAELVVEHLASEEPLEVIAAMNALERRGRVRLIPALVLYHRDTAVLRRALELFANSPRRDWHELARKLLSDPDEAKRIAAARALARHDALDLEVISTDSGAYLSGYVALRRALGDPTLAAVLPSREPQAEARMLGVLAAAADAPLQPALRPLLAEVADLGAESATPAWTEHLADAIRRQGADDHLLARLIERLAFREGRDAARAALVEMGEPAVEALWAALKDPDMPRGLRLQLPAALARFSSPRAAELLMQSVETERDGFVRYKAIRGLSQLVSDTGVRVDRRRAERQVAAHLEEYSRLFWLKRGLEAGDAGGAPKERVAGKLLEGLLEDKVAHSLERAFRLLKIAHPSQDMRRAHLAVLSSDPVARANARELLEIVLRKAGQHALRRLLQGIIDGTPARPASQVAPVVAALPLREQALLALVHDRDVTVAALASLHAACSEQAPLRDALARRPAATLGFAS